MICTSCDIEVEEKVNFCPHCGVSIKSKERLVDKKDLNLIITFYIVELIFIISAYFWLSSNDKLIDQIIVECVSATIVLIFVSFDLKNILQLYRFPKIPLYMYPLVLIAPVLTGFLVYFGIEFINVGLFDQAYNMYGDYIKYPNSFLWAFLFIAITPPIFEELGYRGFLFNQLLKVTTPKVTIILTAFIFALVHFSVISLLWIFPFGLLLGYLRFRYNTLWLGIIIHFIHNLVVLCLDYYYFNNFLV